MRGRSDEVQKKRFVTALVGVAVVLGFLYVFQGSIFGSQNSGAAALEYGSKSLRKFGWGGDEDADDTSSKFSQEDADDGIMAKSFPVRFSDSTKTCFSMLMGFLHAKVLLLEFLHSHCVLVSI